MYQHSQNKEEIDMIIKKRLATLTVVGALAATFGLAGPVNLAYAAGDLTNDGNGYCTSDGAGTGAQIQAAISAGCTVIDLGNNKYSITAPITLSRPITITNGELDMDVSLSGGGVSPLTVSSGGVTLSHLIIDGTYQVKGSQNADLLHLGNGSDSTQTTINDVHFTVGPNVNLAISGSATYPVVIEHCVFDGPSDAAAATTPGYKFHGFIYLTDMSDLTIGGSLLTDGNQFNGSGVNFLTIYVNIVGQSNATIENNQFTGPAVDDSGNYEPTSKYIYAMNTNSVIDVQNNTFNMTDSDQGVAVMVATSSQLTNFIGNNFNGFVADNTGDLPVLYTLTSGDTFGAVTPLPASLSDNTSYGFIVDYVGTVGGIGYFNNATITVSYDQNLPLAVVGTASNMPPTPTTGVTGDVTLDSADPTLIGYSFTGWSSDTTCDPANIYNPGDNVAFGADTTLYACWTKLESPSATAPGTTESGSSTSGNSQNAYGGGQGGTGNTGSTVQLVSSSSSVSGGSGALADGQDTQSLKVTLGGNQTGSTSGFSITTASGNVQLSSVTRNADGSFQLSLTSDTPGIY